MRLVVTVFERSLEDALRVARSVSADLIEIRVDAFGGGDLSGFRGLEVLFTNRGGEPVDVDFGLIDVEFGRPINDPGRTVLSFHDFEGVPDLEPLIDSMTSQQCAYTKIAVTPHNLRENQKLLDALRPGLTLFGMGERGLYSRILAPFFGSELAFVSVDDERSAAPGQISLEKAKAIYGGTAGGGCPPHIFAIVGNPAGHSLSPTIHNPLFRKHRVPGAFTIASVESFDEAIDAPLSGMAVTAPFKDDAFAYAERIGAKIGRNAKEARAANTIVRTKHGVIADNTDVDGFEVLLRGMKGSRAAVLGAGGTSRAAVVALHRAGFQVTVYNRTPRDGALPLDDCVNFTGDVVINTLPKGVNAAISATIDTAYSGTSGSGYQLLQAQAIRQNELFLKAFE